MGKLEPKELRLACHVKDVESSIPLLVPCQNPVGVLAQSAARNLEEGARAPARTAVPDAAAIPPGFSLREPQQPGRYHGPYPRTRTARSTPPLTLPRARRR